MTLSTVFNRFRALALALGCVFLIAMPVVAQAQNVVVRGNQRIDGDSIRQYFQVAPGERLDQAKIDQGVKDLTGPAFSLMCG